VEYWFPSDREINIYDLKVPAVKLRDAKEIPLFGWARKEETREWETLANIYSSKKIMNLRAPDIYNGHWAPSGMENLDQPFRAAVQYSTGDNQEHWRLHYGAWLAGRGWTDEAIAVLSKTDVGLAKALLARLYKSKKEMKAANQALQTIREPWLQLHPQIVVERDKILRNL
jgi:hypothetical protein